MLTKVLNKVKKTLNPSKIVKDEYIDWLSFANAGMLEKGNIYCIDYVMKNLKSDSPFLEIGSFCGLSTNIIYYYAEKHGRNNKFFCADKWVFEGSEKSFLGDTKIKSKDYSSFVKESFKRNIAFFSPNSKIHPIEQFSDDFFELWNKKAEVKDIFENTVNLGGPISFAFIDGNHTYEFTKRDFENTDKHLEKGGFILFDDTFDGSIHECVKNMKEIEDNNKYKLVMKNPNYLFQKVSE